MEVTLCLAQLCPASTLTCLHTGLPQQPHGLRCPEKWTGCTTYATHPPQCFCVSLMIICHCMTSHDIIQQHKTRVCQSCCLRHQPWVSWAQRPHDTFSSHVCRLQMNWAPRATSFKKQPLISLPTQINPHLSVLGNPKTEYLPGAVLQILVLVYFFHFSLWK